MKKANVVGAVLAVFVALPIWFYLLYTVLKATNASELTWFLFWVYVPVNLLCAVLAKLTGEDA
jgi:hypothetical protein